MSRRERFDRSDVPHSKVASVILAVFTLVLLVGGLYIAYHWAQTQTARDQNLADTNLIAGVDTQADVEDPADGYVVSTDIFVNVLVFSVDDINSETAKLTSAQLLSLDITTGTGSLVDIPLDTKLTDGSTKSTISTLFATSGASACIAPFSAAANIQVSHVIVSTGKVWEQIASYEGSGVQAILDSNSELILSIRTDMDNDELIDLAEQVQSTGIANLSRIDAPVSEGDINGTPVSVIKATKLGIAIGTLVKAD